MSAPIAELEKLLSQTVAEHWKLLGGLHEHVEAMKAFRIDAVSAAGDIVEGSRVRIVMLESRRKNILLQIARLYKIPATATLKQIADAAPEHRAILMKRRDELREVTSEIAAKTNVSSRVAGALLGHLNTVVRIVAGAMQQRTGYTKQGTRAVHSRIGMIEAVG